MENIVSKIKNGEKIEKIISKKEMSIKELRVLAREIFGEKVTAINLAGSKKLYLSFAKNLGYAFKYYGATSIVESGTRFGTDLGSEAVRYYKTVKCISVWLESSEVCSTIFIELFNGQHQELALRDVEVIDEVIEEEVEYIFSKIKYATEVN